MNVCVLSNLASYSYSVPFRKVVDVLMSSCPINPTCVNVSALRKMVSVSLIKGLQEIKEYVQVYDRLNAKIMDARRYFKSGEMRFSNPKYISTRFLNQYRTSSEVERTKETLVIMYNYIGSGTKFSSLIDQICLRVFTILICKDFKMPHILGWRINNMYTLPYTRYLKLHIINHYPKLF